MSEELTRRIDDLVAEHLDRLNSGETLDPFAILSDYPELGPAVIEKLETFVDLTSEPAHEAPLGTLGDYTLRRQIGRGGMGVVYEAWQGSLDRRVALKVLPAGIAADNRAFLRFMKEARTAAQLNHRNVVAVYGMGVEQNTPYFAMEFVEGETLAEVLAKIRDAEPDAETPFGKKDDVRYFHNLAEAFADVADGLQHAHSKKVIHRDIKPSNLILDREGHLRILDFGLARFEGQESLTLSGDFLGTPQYMSPEQARRTKIPIDHRTDVYSLGATMYEALCGLPPFRGKDHSDTLSQIIDRDPVPLHRRNARVQRDLDTIVMKCLEKVPGDRYGTAEAFGQELMRFVRGEVIEARGRTRWERLARRAWRNKSRIAAIGAVVLLAALSAFILTKLREESQARSALEYEQQVSMAVRGMSLGGFLTRLESAEEVKSRSHFNLLTAEDFLSVMRDDAHGTVEEWLDTLRKAATKLPGRPEAHYYIAKGLLFLRQADHALEALESACKVDPAFPPAVALLASILEGRGKKTEAEEILKAAARASRNSWTENWLAAQRALKEKRWQEVAVAYGKLIEIEEKGPEVYVGSSLENRLGRGWAWFLLQDFYRALDDATVAEDRHPSEFAPLLLKGAALWNLGHKAKAKTVFEEAYERSGSRDVVALILVNLHIDHLRDADLALAWCRRLRAEGLRLRLRCFCLWWHGRPKDVLGEVQNALSRFPDDPALYRILSQVFTDRLGAFSEGERVAREALGRFPGYVMFYIPLEVALWRQRRFSEAREVLLEAIALNKTDGRLYSELADVTLSMGEVDDAFQFREKAAILDPDDIDVAVRPGWHLVEIGRLDDALQSLDRCIERHPRGPFQRKLKAEALERLGRLEEAVVEARAAKLFPPRWPMTDTYLARLLERQGNLEEAFATHASGIEDSLDDRDFLKQLSLMQHRATKPDRFAPAWHRLAGVLERLRTGRERDARLLNDLALSYLHGDAGKSSTAALELARFAVEESELREPDILLTLAEAQFAAGANAEAVVTLEEALELPTAERCLSRRLKAYREAVLHNLPSYASIDAALRAAAGDGSGDVEILEAFRRVPLQDDAASRLAYLEARVNERAGRIPEAVSALADLAAKEANRPEPLLRLSQCLRDSREPVLAADRLQTALEGSFASRREVWELWTVLSLIDLGRTPAEILATVPRPARSEEMRGFANDIRWLLEQLRDQDAIRIHCGGDEITGKQGEVWGGDRFFRGGRDTRKAWLEGVLDTFPGKIFGTEEPALYKTNRSFPKEQALTPGYCIPLPPGTYRVTLHFAELYWGAPGLRAFDVVLDGQEVLNAYDVFATAGYATAAIETRVVPVTDGALEIVFVPRVDDPMVSAIDIEPVRD